MEPNPHDPNLSRAKRMLERAAHATLFSDGPEIDVSQPVTVPVRGNLPDLEGDVTLEEAARRVAGGQGNDLDACLQATAKRLALQIRDRAFGWMVAQLREIYRRTYDADCPFDDEDLVGWAAHLGYCIRGFEALGDPPNIRRFVLLKGTEEIAGLELNINEFEIVRP